MTTSIEDGRNRQRRECVARAQLLTERFRVSPSCRFNGGDVDLSHRHHRLEGTLCLSASRRKRVSEHARCNLPGQSPAVLTPPALTFLAAIADDRVPVAVGLFLSVGRNLK